MAKLLSGLENPSYKSHEMRQCNNLKEGGWHG